MEITCILMDTGLPYLRIQLICIAMTNPLIRLIQICDLITKFILGICKGEIRVQHTCLPIIPVGS